MRFCKKCWCQAPEYDQMEEHMGICGVEQTRKEYISNVEAYISLIQRVRCQNMQERERVLKLLYALRMELYRDKSTDSIQSYRRLMTDVEAFVYML